MMRLNKVLLAGNLTRDPVLRKTAKGTAVADLGLAVNDGYGAKNVEEERPVFIDVVVWEKQAEVCGEYLKKGSPVLVEGRLIYETWQDKDGQNRSRVRVNAERVSFIGRNGKSAASNRAEVGKPSARR